MNGVEVVWERLLVAVDVVILVETDETDEAELDRWPTGDLYDHLLLTGVPITYDPTSAHGRFGGRPPPADSPCRVGVTTGCCGRVTGIVRVARATSAVSAKFSPRSVRPVAFRLVLGAAMTCGALLCAGGVAAAHTPGPSVAAGAPTATDGGMSPQMALIQGTLNKPCIEIGKPNIQSIVALVNVGLQDIPLLSSQQEQQQQCTDNSTVGDDNFLDQISILSGNG